MKRTIFLSAFISISFVAALAQQSPSAAVYPESGTWINVAPAKAGFTVQLPAKPSESVAPIEGHSGVENHMVTLETKLVGYVMSYIRYPEDITDPEAIKKILDSGRDAGLTAAGAQLKSEKEIKLNGYFGREWDLQLPGGLAATARAYWVRRTFYQIIAVTTPKASDLAEVAKLRQEAAARFLDSFTLGGENAPQ